MKRLLSLAILLGVVQLLFGVAAAWIFRKVDLRFHVLLGFFVIPAFQAGILLWVTRDPALHPLRSAPAVFRNGRAAAVAIGDATVLAIVLTQFRTLAPFVFGIHALIAAGLLFFVRTSLPRAQRWVLLLTAAGLALYGVAGFQDWIALLPTLVGRFPTVLRWIAVYVPLFAITVAVLLRAASAMQAQSNVAAGWIEVSIALLFVAAGVVGSNIFFRPLLVEPWRTVQQMLAYTSVTAVILSAIAVSSLPSGAPDAS